MENNKSKWVVRLIVALAIIFLYFGAVKLTATGNNLHEVEIYVHRGESISQYRSQYAPNTDLWKYVYMVEERNGLKDCNIHEWQKLIVYEE